MKDWKLVEKKIVGEIEENPIETVLYEYIGQHPEVVFGSVTTWSGPSGDKGYGLACDSPRFFSCMGNVTWPTEEDLAAWKIEGDLHESTYDSDAALNSSVNVFCRG